MDTKTIASKPIFFEKNRVFRVYLGGKLFSDFFGDNSEDSFYPEEWICSSTKALNEGSTDEFEGLSTVKGTESSVTFSISSVTIFFRVSTSEGIESKRSSSCICRIIRLCSPSEAILLSTLIIASLMMSADVP